MRILRTTLQNRELRSAQKASIRGEKHTRRNAVLPHLSKHSLGLVERSRPTTSPQKKRVSVVGRHAPRFQKPRVNRFCFIQLTLLTERIDQQVVADYIGTERTLVKYPLAYLNYEHESCTSANIHSKTRIFTAVHVNCKLQKQTENTSHRNHRIPLLAYAKLHGDID